MDITSDGGLSYVRGYMLIIAANLYYLFQRLLFRKMCRKFYERREKHLHPAVIVTEQQVIKGKPWKFTAVRKVLTLMVWMVVVGFILVWRGLFATFDYIVDQLHDKWDVNKVLSSILFQLLVGLTLSFTQRNNAVNLCPTHKIYKYDELEEMDGLFSLHIFGNLLKHEHEESANKIEEGTEVPQDRPAVVDPPPVKRKTFKPTNPAFDLPQYAVRKLSGQLHRSASSSTSSLTSIRKTSQTESNLSDYKTRKFSEQLHRSSSSSMRSLNSIRKTSQSQLELSRYKVRKISGQLNRSLSSSMSSLPSTKKTSQSSIVSEINLQTLSRDGTRKESIGGRDPNNTMPFTNLQSFDVIHEEHNQPEDDQKHQKEATPAQNEAEEKLSCGNGNAYNNPPTFNKDEASFQETKPSSSEEFVVIGPKASAQTSNHEMNMKEHFQFERSTIFRSSFKRDHFKEIEESDEVIESAFDYKHCKVCTFLGIITYIYTIHHRQVFLHIFGGMFWSTTWKLFDFATQSFFINTASDIPALVLIAIMCHSLNHLVLFRFKEMATGIHWKTFWEFFCGLFTVWLWAPTWYIWDIIEDATGKLSSIILLIN